MENVPFFVFLDEIAAPLRASSPFGPSVDPLPAYMAFVTLLGLGLLAAYIWRGARLRQERHGVADLRERVAVAETRAERMAALDHAVTEAREERDTLLGALNTATATLESERRGHAARLDDLQTRFRSVASEVLEGNSKAFLDRVTERFATHSETAARDLDALVKPLSERLCAFDVAMRDMEKTRSDAYGAIRSQVEELKLGQRDLTGETRKLVQALRAPKTRGRWGEMQLRQVFELSGMSEHVDFNTEVSHRTDDGLQRPDAIVSMPGARSLIVDAKTPLDAYLDALESETPELREAAIKRHAAQVREHVRLLASKKYHDLLAGTPDFVVMFIPGDVFLSAAVEADPGLLQRAMEARVVIATPSTLIALLRTIAFGWQQEAIAENAVAIHREAKELYDRLATFAGHLEKVGKSLAGSVDSYNRAVGSLEARVLPSARKLEALKVVQAPEVALSGADRVDAMPRRITAPELIVSGEEDP